MPWGEEKNNKTHTKKSGMIDKKTPQSQYPANRFLYPQPYFDTGYAQPRKEHAMILCYDLRTIEGTLERQGKKQKTRFIHLGRTSGR